MTHIVHSKANATSSLSFKHLAAAAMVASCASFAQTAMAEVIDFNKTDNQFMGHDDYFLSDGGNFWLSAYSNVVGAQPGDLVGGVFDGSDPQGCGIACPTNNATNYYGVLNDGILQIDAAKVGGTVSILGFDASFLGHAQGVSYPAVAGLLRVQGFYANGTSLYETYQLAGPVGGNFQFQHYDTSSAFGAQQFSSVAFYGFSCNTAGSCGAFSSNKGQFALDNVVAAVPEPSTYAMLLLGLAGIGFAARRRKQA